MSWLLHNCRCLVMAVLIFCNTFSVLQAKDNTTGHLPRIDFGEPGGPVGKLTFFQQAEVQDMPTEVRVYRVQPIGSKKDKIFEIFQALPIKSSEETTKSLHQLKSASETSANFESASIGGWTVRVREGGQFSIYNDELINRPFDLKNSPVVPSSEEARKVADTFLASIGPLSTNIYFSDVSVGDEVVIALDDKPGSRIVKSLLVRYSALIDGIQLENPVSVRVGVGSEVLSMSSRLRQLAPDATVGILSPQEALDKLSAREGYIDEGPSWHSTGNITSVKLKYWLGNIADDLSYLMPVYVFEGDAVADGKPTRHWKAYVEAVRPEYLEAEPGRQ